MKTLALTLCLLAACTLTCATQCGDECEPYYAPASLSRWSVSPLSNSGLEPVLAQEGDTLPRNAYGIRIACPADVLPADTVGASAFCGIEYLIDTPVISLRVYTLFDLDAQHPTGAEVTDLFRCRLPAGQSSYNSPRPAGNPATLNATAYTHYNEPSRAPAILSLVDNLRVQADLLLITPPAAAAEARFEVELLRRDSSVLRLTTPSVLLR